MTIQECKSLLFRLAIKHGVSPGLISSKLLSKEDKDDMLAGLITAETVECAVVAWKEVGMLDYVNGHISL